MSDYSYLIKKYQAESQNNSKDPDVYLHLGMLYCEQREYQLAASTFSRVISLDPKRFIAYYYSGIAYACASKPDLAGMEWEVYIKNSPRFFDEREQLNIPFEFNESVHVKRAIAECIQRKKLLPGDAHAVYYLALAYILTRQYTLAKVELEEVLRIKPSFLKACFLIVEIYLKERETNKAVEILRKLIKEEPNSFIVHYKLGNLLIQQNDIGAAIHVLQKALQLKPNTDIILIELGKAYKLQGKEEMAKSYYTRVLELNSESSDAHYEMGVLYEEKYDYDSAIQCYQKAIRINENKGEAYSHLGNIYKRQGKIHMAIENFVKSVKYFPKDAYLHYQLGEAYHSIKRYDDAIKEFREAVSFNSKDTFSYLNLGISLSRINEFEEALQALKKVLEIKPESADPYYHMALIYSRMGHLTFAREYIEKFLKVKPNDTYARFALGNIHLRFGDLDNAIEQYKKAIDSYPDHPYARFNLASSYARAGNFDLAEEEFSKAMEFNPPDTEDEMILFATLASYHTILQTLAKTMNELKTAFNLYEEAKSKYQDQEKVKNRITDLFKKILPETVAEDLITDDKEFAEEQREVTVVFSDIRGYTNLTELIGPSKAMKVLNDYYSHMSKISNKYGGSLLYFQGDAQMVIFGAPKEDPDHPLNALKAACEMKRTVSFLSDKWFKNEEKSFEIAVGMTTGEVVMGFINDGTRLQYTAIGDTVNVAARLQDISKEHGSAIMLNEKAYNCVKEHLRVKRLDSIHLKGKSEPINVFKVEGFLGGEFPSFKDFVKEAVSMNE